MLIRKENANEREDIERQESYTILAFGSTVVNHARIFLRTYICLKDITFVFDA